MNRIFLFIVIFISGFLFLVFMPISEDKALYDNYIYLMSNKGLNERRVVLKISENEINNNDNNIISKNDLICNFDDSIDKEVREYNELMIQYSVRYANAANSKYNPPVRITGKALLGMAKEEKTPEPSYAVIWQGYWDSILKLKNRWMDIRYTDVDINLAINGNTDGPLQIGLYYGRNNSAIQDELGLVGTTNKNPRKERINQSLLGDRFNALDSLNMTAGELAKVMSNMPEGECKQLLRSCNEYAVVMLAAYSHNFGQGVFTLPDKNTSIAPYADFSKKSLYKFTKAVSESKEVREIIEKEIKKKGLNFVMYWNQKPAQEIFLYFKENPIGDEKIDAWINKTYNASCTGTQWYAGNISCAHRLFYGINAYANTVWLELYTSGQIKA